MQEAVSEYHLLQQILDLHSKKSRLNYTGPLGAWRMRGAYKNSEVLSVLGHIAGGGTLLV